MGKKKEGEQEEGGGGERRECYVRMSPLPHQTQLETVPAN